MGTLALILVPAALFVAALVIVLAFRGEPAADGVRTRSALPVGWIALSVGLVLLGVFVFPRLLGFTFLFLPFLWMRGFGRRHERRGREQDLGR